LVIVFLAAGLLAPNLRRSTDKSAEQAREQAALARRELARYNQTLPRVGELADAAELGKKDADLAPAVTASSERLKQVAGEYAKLARSAQDLAAKSGLPAPTLPPFNGDAASVQKALESFAAAVKANDALLKAAASHAQSAAGLDATAIGVSQTVGLTAYVQAAGLFAQAHDLRTQQAQTQARLLDQGSARNQARGKLSYYRGLDAAKLLAQLRADLEEISRLRAAAAEAAKSLAAQVDEQAGRLNQVAEELKQVTVERLTLEQKGFIAGNDQSFGEYRQQYTRVLERAQRLQAAEQELRFGGRFGAELVGDDPTTAELRGGRPVNGLEELQRRLMAAQERSRRLDHAHVSLDEQIKHSADQGQSAQGEITRYQQRLTDLETGQKAAAEELRKLAADAFNKEDEALAAAKKGIQAFGQAQRAADAWVRTVRDLQGSKDPSRKNERLRLILQDPYFEQAGRTAEAATQALAGRIYIQRAEHTARLIQDVQLFAQLEPDFEFDATPFETQLDAARTDGQAVLDKAAETYGRLAEKQSPTAWVPQAAAAATYHLLAQLDDAQAEVYRDKAREVIGKAVEKTEKSPYLRPYRQFRDALAAAKAPPPPAEAQPGTPGAELEPEEDFFLRED
jgi:predicted  nucleic acid-binding Zn-ribbon protein